MIYGFFEQTPGFWTNLSQWAAAVSVWAAAKAAHRKLNVLDDLTTRLRHPLLWRVRHPVQATRRALRADR
jgi:hypothetical protein